MRLIATLAALTALTVLPLTLNLTTAQAATPADAALQTTATPVGLPITAVAEWITAKGGTVTPVERNGDSTWITVRDGALTWFVFFYSCEGDVCGDIQFAASFVDAGITQTRINDWNRERRFLKATWFQGEGDALPQGVVQYDVLLNATGIDQLTDPTAVWIDMVAQFATFIGMQPAPAGSATPMVVPAQ